MGFYTGRSGRLFLMPLLYEAPIPAANQAVLKIRDWSIDTSLELLETTTIDAAVKSYTPGMVSSNGSATVMYYRSESGDVGVQFEQMLGKIMKTTTDGVSESDRIGMVLRAGSQPNTGLDIKDDIAFNAYIVNTGIKVGTGELTSVSISFTVDGPFLEVVDS